MTQTAMLPVSSADGALILGALSFAISHESYSDADLVLAFKIMDRFPALNTQFKYLRDMEP